MLPARAAIVAVLVVVIALMPLVGVGSAGSAPGLTVYAAPAESPSLQNGNNNGNTNKNGNNNQNNNDNDDGDDNDNDDGNDVDDGDDNRREAPPAPAAPTQVNRPTTSACSVPGQESSATSADGRVTVRVFGTMPRPIRLTILMPLEPGVTPAPPGPIVGGLLFQVIAEECGGGPIPVLPAEVNLGIRYGDADVGGLNEQGFTIARLDTNTNQWRAAEKQVADPANDFTSATIADMGYYVVYQRP